VRDSCPLASNWLASSVSSAVRRHAFRGISGPRAHPLEEFMRRSPMGIQILGGVLCAVPRCSRRATGLLPAARSGPRILSDRTRLARSLPAELPPGARVCGRVLAGHIDDPFFLPSALVLVITAGPTIQLPSVSIVPVALGVVIGVISASEKVRAAVQTVVTCGSWSIGVLVKAADPTGTTEIVGMRVVAVVGVVLVVEGVRFCISDPEVMAVVKRVAVTVVRHVVVTVGTVKTAERAERVIRGMRMVAVEPGGAVMAMRSRRTRVDRDPKGTRRRFVTRISLGSGP
jgi:hypothetical protein